MWERILLLLLLLLLQRIQLLLLLLQRILLATEIYTAQIFSRFPFFFTRSPGFAFLQRGKQKSGIEKNFLP